jgi:hypothetical protein
VGPSSRSFDDPNPCSLFVRVGVAFSGDLLLWSYPRRRCPLNMGEVKHDRPAHGMLVGIIESFSVKRATLTETTSVPLSSLHIADSSQQDLIKFRLERWSILLTPETNCRQLSQTTTKKMTKCKLANREFITTKPDIARAEAKVLIKWEKNGTRHLSSLLFEACSSLHLFTLRFCKFNVCLRCY